MHSYWQQTWVYIMSQCWCESDMSSSTAHRCISCLGVIRYQRLWGFQLRPFPSCLNTIASLHCHPQLIPSQMPTSPSLRLQQRCRMKTIWKEASPSRGPVGMETPVFVNGGFFYTPGQRFPTVSWSKRTLSGCLQAIVYLYKFTKTWVYIGFMVLYGYVLCFLKILNCWLFVWLCSCRLYVLVSPFEEH